METNPYTSVRDELERFLVEIKEEVDSLGSTNANVKVGSWENITGNVMAYLSYFPNNSPQEESIDVTIEVKLGNEGSQFSADICWSSGEIISELAHKEFGYISLEELIYQIKKMTEEITLDIISFFKSIAM